LVLMTKSRRSKVSVTH